MLSALQNANLALRFLLELALLAALAYGGYHLDLPGWLRAGLAVALPVTAAVVWALFVAPKATHPLPAPVHLAVQVTLLGLAVVLLCTISRQGVALGFATVAITNAALMAAWGQ